MLPLHNVPRPSSAYIDTLETQAKINQKRKVNMYMYVCVCVCVCACKHLCIVGEGREGERLGTDYQNFASVSSEIETPGYSMTP